MHNHTMSKKTQRRFNLTKKKKKEKVILLHKTEYVKTARKPFCEENTHSVPWQHKSSFCCSFFRLSGKSTSCFQSAFFLSLSNRRKTSQLSTSKGLVHLRINHSEWEESRLEPRNTKEVWFNIHEVQGFGGWMLVSFVLGRRFDMSAGNWIFMYLWSLASQGYHTNRSYQILTFTDTMFHLEIFSFGQAAAILIIKCPRASLRSISVPLTSFRSHAWNSRPVGVLWVNATK